MSIWLWLCKGLSLAFYNLGLGQTLYGVECLVFRVFGLGFKCLGFKVKVLNYG
jgi:hypothetical protein